MAHWSSANSVETARREEWRKECEGEFREEEREGGAGGTGGRRPVTMEENGGVER